MVSDRGFRLDRDLMMLEVAQLVAKRGTCERAQVGAVISIDGRIISSGYVGAPPGAPHCIDGTGCEIGPNDGCVRTVHAEANAIAFAARHGTAVGGATIYCTHSPCRECAKLIASAGIRRVVYIYAYRDESGLQLLETLRIPVERWL